MASLCETAGFSVRGVTDALASYMARAEMDQGWIRGRSQLGKVVNDILDEEERQGSRPTINEEDPCSTQAEL